MIVDMAYAIQASPRYRSFKRFIYNLLENNSYHYKRYVDFFMIFLIFSSVVILIREVKSPVYDTWRYFNDYVISFIFLVEYLLRVWVSSNSAKAIIDQYETDEFLQRDFRISKALKTVFAAKLNYMRSFQAAIDFLAIMPFFHELRLLRLFILFRVFKLFRYTQSLKYFISVLATKKTELFMLAMFVAIIMSISAVLIYVMEANNPNSQIDTLFEAFYWSLVTISTVGYGDFTPATDGGRAVAMLIILGGIGVLAFSTSIIVTAFTEKLDEIRESRTISDISNLKSFYLVCGYGEIAQQVCAKLRRNGHNIVVMDADHEKIERARKHGLTSFHADPGSLESYRLMHIDLDTQVKSILSLQESDVQNVFTALTVRSINKKTTILSLLYKQQNRKKLMLAGVDEIVYSQELIGLMAKEISGRPVAFEAIHLLRSEDSGIVAEEVVIDHKVAQHYDMVSKLNEKEYHLILIGVYLCETGKTVFHPDSAFPLRKGDSLIILGEHALIKEFRLGLHQKRHA
jgi:voltage-gated potassium channel